MPVKFSPEKHIQKAQHNLHFCQAVAALGDDYRDWQVVALFYAALHVIQAYFADKTVDYPGNHSERDQKIATNAHLKTIYNEYRELKTLSSDCRYKCNNTNDHDVREAHRLYIAIESHTNRSPR
jgi:hypothetical protein